MRVVDERNNKPITALFSSLDIGAAYTWIGCPGALGIKTNSDDDCEFNSIFIAIMGGSWIRYKQIPEEEVVPVDACLVIK